MRRIRTTLSTWLLALACKVEPPRWQPLPPLVPTPKPPVDPSAHSVARCLRSMAEDVESGRTLGFRVVWYGPPYTAEVWIYVPKAIGDA